MKTEGQEIGYQYLDTSFSGTQTPFLSGSCDPELDFYILLSDRGVASTLDQTELKPYF
jgi:hypothetical protein